MVVSIPPIRGSIIRSLQPYSYKAVLEITFQDVLAILNKDPRFTVQLLDKLILSILDYFGFTAQGFTYSNPIHISTKIHKLNWAPLNHPKLNLQPSNPRLMEGGSWGLTWDATVIPDWNIFAKNMTSGNQVQRSDWQNPLPLSPQDRPPHSPSLHPLLPFRPCPGHWNRIAPHSSLQFWNRKVVNAIDGHHASLMWHPSCS